MLEDFGNGSSVKFEVENETGGVAAVTAALPGLHQWVFVAGELNGSNGALTLYINGKLAASTVTTIRPFGTLIAGDQPGLGIGGLEANFGPANNVDFNGSIDELRLSNTALPPSQFLDAPGTVFGDSNANGKKDSTELGLGLWTVYLDINNNGKLDTGDKSVTTDINGNFTFTSLAAGTYYLRLVPVTGDTATTPALIKVVLTAGEISTGNLFGQD